MAELASLPGNILLQIVGHLNWSGRLKCEFVCRRWRRIMSYDDITNFTAEGTSKNGCSEVAGSSQKLDKILQVIGFRFGHNLRSFKLSHFELSEFATNTLQENCDNLKTLHLHACRFLTKEAAAYMPKFVTNIVLDRLHFQNQEEKSAVASALSKTLQSIRTLENIRLVAHPVKETEIVHSYTQIESRRLTARLTNQAVQQARMQELDLNTDLEKPFGNVKTVCIDGPSTCHTFLRYMPSLTVLKITGATHLSQTAAVEITANCPNLEIFWLLRTDHVSALTEPLISLRRLKEVRLSGMIRDDFIREISKGGGLKSLEVEVPKLCQNTIFDAISLNPELEELKVCIYGKQELSGEFIRQILIRSSNLLRFELKDSCYDRSSMEIDPILEPSKLEHLTLSGIKLTSSGVKVICHACQQLSSIRIENCLIDVQSVALPKLSELKEVTLSHICSSCDEIVLQLAKGRHLQTFSAEKVRLSENSLIRIASLNPLLKEVNLRNVNGLKRTMLDGLFENSINLCRLEIDTANWEDVFGSILANETCCKLESAILYSVDKFELLLFAFRRGSIIRSGGELNVLQLKIHCEQDLRERLRPMETEILRTSRLKLSFNDMS